jgi:hypothetical protein
MLDPKEQKKGGFGAFAAREQQRSDDLKAAEQTVAPGDAATAPKPAGASAPATPATPATPPLES